MKRTGLESRRKVQSADVIVMINPTTRRGQGEHLEKAAFVENCRQGESRACASSLGRYEWGGCCRGVSGVQRFSGPQGRKRGGPAAADREERSRRAKPTSFRLGTKKRFMREFELQNRCRTGEGGELGKEGMPLSGAMMSLYGGPRKKEREKPARIILELGHRYRSVDARSGEGRCGRRTRDEFC